jgi:hypothetical protein
VNRASVLFTRASIAAGGGDRAACHTLRTLNTHMLRLLHTHILATPLSPPPSVAGGGGRAPRKLHRRLRVGQGPSAAPGNSHAQTDPESESERDGVCERNCRMAAAARGIGGRNRSQVGLHAAAAGRIFHVCLRTVQCLCHRLGGPWHAAAVL